MPPSRPRSCVCSTCDSIRGWAAARTSARPARPRSRPRSRRACKRSKVSTRTASCAVSSTRCAPPSAPTSTRSTPPARPSRSSPSSSPAAGSTACRCPSRSTRSWSIRRGWRPCICGSARWRAAASAGPTGRRISAPRSSAWSRPSRSRTPSSCRSAPKADSSLSSCPRARARPFRRKAPPPTSCSCRRCSTSPTISAMPASSRPPMWCATMAMILTWWSPPTRAPRPSRTSPTRSRTSTVSG